MQWLEIREHYPNKWVVMEAIRPKPIGETLHFEEIQVSGAYPDFSSAWQHYKHLHHLDRYRVYLVYHTINPDLEIGIIEPFGLRLHED